MVAIVTDSAASIPAEIASELGIEVVPLYLRFGEAEYRDGVDIDDFYERLAGGGPVPTTAAPSPGDFLAAIERTGDPEVVCVTVGSRVSGMHQVAGVAALGADARVEVVDSGNASMAEGFAAVEAARTARAGGTLEEVAGRAREIAGRARLVAAIDTLEYLRRSGRLSNLMGYVGTMLGIRPVFAFRQGDIAPVARPRTRGRALERVLQEAVGDLRGSRAHVAAVHAAAEADARVLLDRLLVSVDVVEALVAEFTPAMGVHTGPGVVGLAYWAE